MKNFKLLLATTAILSTGLSMGAMAELNVASESLTANVTASISIVEPATIVGGDIRFPTITTAGSGTISIVIKADGTIDESKTTAQVIKSDAQAVITPIFVSGANIGHAAGLNVASAQTVGGDLDTLGMSQSVFNNRSVMGAAVQSITFPTTITLSDVSENNSGECGTVKNITTDVSTAAPTLTTREGVEGANVPFGATFEMNPNFHPKNGFARCTGSGIVTYFPYNKDQLANNFGLL